MKCVVDDIDVDVALVHPGHFETNDQTFVVLEDGIALILTGLIAVVVIVMVRLELSKEKF